MGQLWIVVKAPNQMLKGPRERQKNTFKPNEIQPNNKSNTLPTRFEQENPSKHILCAKIEARELL
jgi:hypothetical protein